MALIDPGDLASRRSRGALLAFMTPFGASGLMPGTMGRLLGLQLSHRAPHIVRAVVEGLAFELNRHLDFLRGSGQPITEVVLGGGAAASRVTPQLIG